MRIIEGDFAGSEGRIINATFGGGIIEIRGGVFDTTKIKLPKDVETMKLINKDEQRTVVQLVIVLLLGITGIGLIPAIMLFVLWKRITFTVGVKTKNGKRFVAQGDSADWKIAKKYVGLGSLDLL